MCPKTRLSTVARTVILTVRTGGGAGGRDTVRGKNNKEASPLFDGILVVIGGVVGSNVTGVSVSELLSTVVGCGK